MTNFKAQKRGASPGIYVTLKSSEQLDMNLSSSFVELTLSTLTLWDKEGKKVLQKARGSYAPYRLVNRTGTTIQVWSDVSGKKGEAKRLINGEDADWRFDDWKTTREVRFIYIFVNVTTLTYCPPAFHHRCQQCDRCAIRK